MVFAERSPSVTVTVSPASALPQMRDSGPLESHVIGNNRRKLDVRTAKPGSAHSRAAKANPEQAGDLVGIATFIAVGKTAL